MAVWIGGPVGKRLVITEKPSVGRDIAAALGGFVEEDEFLESEEFVVTWAVGHLLELSEPEDYDKVWRSWEIKHLPIIPTQFQLRPREGQKKRLDKIKKLGTRKDIEGIINACDAGREGELIYRRIVEFCSLEQLPQQRLWLQSMTKQAIRDAFDHLRPGSELDALADAAWLRSVGDWLVGMNATRALTQRLKTRHEREAWSAGRVQTPTLNILVARERQILAHVPVPYWEIVATFAHGATAQQWEARFHDPKRGVVVEEGAEEEESISDRKPSRIFERAEVDRIVAALEAAPTPDATEKRKKSKQSPPLPFDLTSLQREANRRYSMSARRTLDAAQRLYEGHKVLTYPRTDSRHLPEDYGPVVTQLVGALKGLPGADWADLARISGEIEASGPQNLDKVLDSTKVRDHFAIVPTGNPVPPDLSGDDRRVFDLAVRQFLAALMGPATWATVERFVDVPTATKPARFRASAKMLEIPGFLEALGQEAGAGTSLPPLVPGNDEPTGVTVDRREFQVEDKATKPPPRYSEAQLLRMMETAGERVDAEELSEAMKERGLGTPATRADTIERLVSTGYSRRVGGKLVPASKAMRLMDVLERVNANGLASPRLTGEWEHALNEVANGSRKRDAVRTALVDYTLEITNALKGFEYDELYGKEPPVGKCPNCGKDVVESVWGYRCLDNTPEDKKCDFILWKDRFGRYIDRNLARRLLDERTVGPIDGFVDRSGRELIQGTLTLKRDEEKGSWVLDTKFGAATSDAGEAVPEQVIGKAFDCVVHPGCEVVETTHRWVCAKVLAGEEKVGPQLPKKVCQRDLEPEEVVAFFGEEARTPLIEGFTSRRGRPFRGMLIRKPTGKHGFEFPERPERPGKVKKAEGEEGEEAAAKPKKKAGSRAAAKSAEAEEAPKAKKAPAKAPAKKKGAAAKSSAAAKGKKKAPEPPPPPPRPVGKPKKSTKAKPRAVKKALEAPEA
ncbi:MAG: DNA topoisomerase [Myxococcota bacterium]